MEEDFLNAIDNVNLRGNRNYIHYDYVRKLAAQLSKLDTSDLYLALILYELRTEFKQGVLHATVQEINDIYDNSYSAYMKDEDKNATLINPKYLNSINFMLEKENARIEAEKKKAEIKAKKEEKAKAKKEVEE